MHCEENEVEMCDGEILDELTTNRGELKVRTMSFNEDKRSQVLSFFFPFISILLPSRLFIPFFYLN